jgi:hypothetical protein
MARIGRPPLGQDKKSELITLWVVPALKRELEDTAARLNVSQSEVVRDAVTLFLGLDLSVDKQDTQHHEEIAV